MKINISMPLVNDGDAIIIHLKRTEEEQLVILVDGGHSGDADMITGLLTPILTASGKLAPDLIICTHYDLDHIGGLQRIAEHYGTEIGEVWIHMPNLIEEVAILAAAITDQKTTSQDKPDLVSLKSSVLGVEHAIEHMDPVLESYDDMKILVAFLRSTEIPIKEPFPDLSLDGWPEIKILGPTRAFYDSKLGQLNPKTILIQEIFSEAQKTMVVNNREIMESIAKGTSACDKLDAKNKSGVTAVNQVSVIMEITCEGKKYLFTGDANLDSFHNIPDYKNALKNVYWLKVPHHGSNNNSDSKLFDIMQPEFAYISGKKHFNPEVAGCLESKGAVVKVTSKHGDLFFP